MISHCLPMIFKLVKIAAERGITLKNLIQNPSFYNINLQVTYNVYQPVVFEFELLALLTIRTS